MAERRPMGSLETDVLQELWRTDAFVTPAEVRDALPYDLAYTTISTILTRLWSKGLVEREKVGRAFAYRAKLGEDELTASRMHSELGRAHDRSAALSRFVTRLGKRDVNALRKLLE